VGALMITQNDGERGEEETLGGGGRGGREGERGEPGRVEYCVVRTHICRMARIILAVLN
jgi:hypothetical protein